MKTSIRAAVIALLVSIPLWVLAVWLWHLVNNIVNTLASLFGLL